MSDVTTPVQQYAERLLERERGSVPDQMRQYLDMLARIGEYASLAEELTVGSLKRGTLTDTDRAEALALPGLRGIHWRL